MLEDLQPDDLIKFGLIPEFVGRVPIVATLEPLDRKALMSILCEPKNALVNQYRKLLDMDGIDLEFEEEAIGAIADRALKLKTGARGLRTIVENAILGLMYDAPGDKDIEKILVTADCINKGTPPVVIRRNKVG